MNDVLSWGGLGWESFCLSACLCSALKSGRMGDCGGSFVGFNQFACTTFESAALTRQSLLTGYQDGMVASRSFGSSAIVDDVLSGVSIAASFGLIDGPGNVLGRAGFTAFAIDDTGFKLATDGTMQFDSADFGSLSSSQIDSLILHEMAHVLGFGTLWTDNSVYVNGSGEFTGANATVAWQNEFGQTGTPDVELGALPGTNDAHWNEFDGGANFTGVQVDLGRDMTFELMTGWLNTSTNPNWQPFISEMTLASFRDIGFTTAAIAVPEPDSLLILSGDHDRRWRCAYLRLIAVIPVGIVVGN